MALKQWHIWTAENKKKTATATDKRANKIVKYQQWHCFLLNMRNDRFWNSDLRDIHNSPISHLEGLIDRWWTGRKGFKRLVDLVCLEKWRESCRNQVSTLQVKVFAWSPIGNQLFWFRETFLQIKSPASKFYAPVATKMVTTWRVARQMLIVIKPFNSHFRELKVKVLLWEIRNSFITNTHWYHSIRRRGGREGFVEWSHSSFLPQHLKLGSK